MRPPALAEKFEAAVAVRGRYLHLEDLRQLPVEITHLRLWTFDDSDHHVADCLQPFRQEPQGHRLARSRVAGDEGKAAVLDQALDTPAEALHLLGDEERLGGDVGCEGVPLEAVEGEELLRVHPSTSFLSGFGR